MENSETRKTTAHETENIAVATVTEKPQNIPDKFWDSESGALRTDVLMNSYNELEKRFAGNLAGAPESADDYDLKIEHEHLAVDPAINERLHVAGFSNEQVQLVYDLALEQLAPIAHQLSETMERKNQIERLESYFGGKQRWAETERQLTNWGRSNMSLDAFETMNQSYEGVIAMHRMMQNNEPAILGNGHPSSSVLSESELKTMMNDPRYWRDQNPAYIEQIRHGFEMLYPGKA